MNRPGKLIIFSAPSGSGKSTIIDRLTNEYGIDGVFSISATSRPPRGEEKDGVHYYFLSVDEFQQRIQRNDFLEYEEVYPSVYYGTLRSEVDKALESGRNVLLDIDVVGALNVKKIYGDRACTLFIQPPSIGALRERLLNRGTDSLQKIEERLQKAEHELSYAPYFDRRVINDDLDEACQIACSIIQDFLNEKERHILLFPGSFSPMHVGHLCLANYIIETRPEVDELWMSLTPASPFKDHHSLLPDELRIKWAQHVLGRHSRIKLSLVEQKLPKPNFTINTLEHLIAEYPTYRFSLMMGMDSWLSFPQWHRANELLGMTTIYVCARPGYPTPEEKKPEHKEVIYLKNTPFFDISSTRIRTLLKQGATLPYILQARPDDPIYQELVDSINKLEE